MKLHHPNHVRGILFIAIAIIFCVPSTMAYAEDEATVDDLFVFFLDNWVKPHVASSSAGETFPVTEDPVNDNFLKELKKARSEFGHLGEYWELRAFIDLTEEDRTRSTSRWDFISFTEPYYNFMEINPLMLRKAVRADSSRAAAHLNLGRVYALEAWPLQEGLTVRMGEKPFEYWEALQDGLSNAREADSSNGYYPIMEAAAVAMMDDLDGAFELLETAANCSRFSTPMLFPQSYFIENLSDFKENFASFQGLDYSEQRYIADHFYLIPVTANLTELRRCYREIMANAIENGDWQETFNTLIHSACRMAMTDDGDPITQLQAMSLLRGCLEEARTVARETGDKDLELMLLAMYHEMESIKVQFRTELKVEDRTAVYMRPIVKELLSNRAFDATGGPLGDFSKYYGSDEEDYEFVNQLDLIFFDNLAGVLDCEENQVFSDRFVWHRFDRIKSFDMAKPVETYDWWLTTGRYTKPKDGTGYRDDCFT